MVFAVPQINITSSEIADMMDVEYSIEEFFEPEELEQMSIIELKRYKNRRGNYEVMKRMGECLKIFNRK